MKYFLRFYNEEKKTISEQEFRKKLSLYDYDESYIVDDINLTSNVPYPTGTESYHCVTKQGHIEARLWSEQE
jgi:hypothetical protein